MVVLLVYFSHTHTHTHTHTHLTHTPVILEITRLPSIPRKANWQNGRVSSLPEMVICHAAAGLSHWYGVQNICSKFQDHYLSPGSLLDPVDLRQG